MTSPGPVGVGPGGWGVSPMAAGTVEWEAHRGWRAGSGCGFRQPAGRASSVRGWGGGVAAILAPASRHEGGVGARGGGGARSCAGCCACSAPRVLRAGVTSHLERRPLVGCGGPRTGSPWPLGQNEPMSPLRSKNPALMAAEQLGVRWVCTLGEAGVSG